ncbi:hypothetical protein HZA99_06055 [Candidatus Woesearchaeota archaeon]|nr:hypothetical protein [Candidatus Woesearchaeota archaeon]
MTTTWFEKLKAIFNININSPLVKVNLTYKSNNLINDSFKYDETKKQLDLFIDQVPSEKRSELKSVIRDYIADDNLLLENKTLSTLENLYDYNKENPDKVILSFFKPIIPPSDFEALQAALYLRNAFRRGEDVRKLKRDIRNRGERHNNISNLCTAGYFEKFFMPLYNSSQDRFKELYDIILQKSLLAVFVHEQMNAEDIVHQIKKRLEISKRYGIGFIHIHGIGESNVNKIKLSISDQKNFFDFFEKNIYEKDNIIILELLLK